MQRIVRLALGLTLSLTCTYNLNAAGSSWLLWNTETEDAIQEVCKSGIKVDPATLQKVTTPLEQTNATIVELKPTLKKASDALDSLSQHSLLNEKNIRATMKSCAFTTLGFFICCCGTKMVYDSCEDIHEKITREENEYLALQEILSWRDFIRPTVGLMALGLGYTIIANQ